MLKDLSPKASVIDFFTEWMLTEFAPYKTEKACRKVFHTVKNHAYDSFSKIAAENLTEKDMLQLVVDMIKGGYSYATIGVVYGYVIRPVRSACDCGIIPYNRVVDIRLPEMYRKAEIVLGLKEAEKSLMIDPDMVPQLVMTRNATLEVFMYYLMQNKIFEDKTCLSQATVKCLNGLFNENARIKSIACLTPFDINATVNNIRLSKYSPVYKYYLCLKFKNILLCAYELGLTDRKLYDFQLHRATSDIMARGYSDDQMYLLNNAFESSSHGNYFKVIESTGLSRGEALGLTQSDYSRNTGELKINRIILESTKRSRRIQTDLQGNEKRTIRLPQVAIDAIESELAKQTLFQAKAERLWNNPEKYIFTDSHGNLMLRKSIETEVYRIRNKTGVETFSATKLRENYIITELNSGVHLKALADYLGLVTMRPLLRYIPPERRHLYNA